MRIAFLKAVGDYGSPLYYSLADGLKSLGHSVHTWKENMEYDYVFVFSCVQSVPEFEYQHLDEIKGRFVLMDTTEYGWWTHNDRYAKDFYSLFAPREYDKTPFQVPLLEFLRGKAYPYFRREFYKGVQYPYGYYPIDYPLFGGNMPYLVAPDREQYLRRSYDLVLRWGESHPNRWYLDARLRMLPLRMILVTGSDKKVPQRQYWDEMAQARSTVSYDGYGSGGFRETEGMARCMLFRAEMAIEQAYAPLPGEHFVEYHVWEEYDAVGRPCFVDTDLDVVVKEWLSNLDACWKVYFQGFAHLIEYRTEQATAQYVLDTIDAHDWSRETKTEVSFKW